MGADGRREGHAMSMLPGGDGLLVVMSGTEAGPWATVVEETGRVLGLEPHPKRVDGGVAADARQTWIEQMLAGAVGTEGPVLILPPTADARRSANPNRRIARAVIASEASEPVMGAAAILYRRFADAGIPTSIVVVLTSSALPRIWEGSGYHAHAWTNELRRRHGSAARDFTIVTGEPSDELEKAAAHADVLVLPWRNVAPDEGAQLVRAVLGELSVPCLLVPLAWAQRSVHLTTPSGNKAGST